MCKAVPSFYFFFFLSSEGKPGTFTEALFASCLCAEPHEICREDNFSNVVWKMTPAGDMAAVRCPPNAMGKAEIKAI